MLVSVASPISKAMKLSHIILNNIYCIFSVAKRKSLFDDRPAEIQELTYIIKGDLNSLNQQIARLQDISKSQRKTTNAKHLLSHSSNMVIALQAKLANMSTDFKQILEVRTENLKHQKSRRDQVIVICHIITITARHVEKFKSNKFLCFRLIYSSVKVPLQPDYHHHRCAAMRKAAYCSPNRIKSA